jgi:hypothetical protein
MTSEQEQDFVMELVDRMLAVIAGAELPCTITALSLAVAAVIISTSKNPADRELVCDAFTKIVRNFLTPDWIELIKAHTRPVDLWE